jgi:hypothetical protein
MQLDDVWAVETRRLIIIKLSPSHPEYRLAWPGLACTHSSEANSSESSNCGSVRVSAMSKQ